MYAYEKQVQQTIVTSEEQNKKPKPLQWEIVFQKITKNLIHFQAFSKEK